MALTATATPRVRQDVLHQLGLKNPKWFLSSFDRPNLVYKVIPKSGKSVLTEIIANIKVKFANCSGIIYCLSRNDCDSVATQLKANGIKGAAYHAGLSDSQRADVQTKWISDKIKVVCATIAFGMGIDKPDVRYVIHYSLPKSVEGYYQEAGRAGRDGELAHCWLYYNYSDMHRIRKLIDMDREGSQASKQTHINNLWRMVAYCENKTECRRAMQLNYFGERFSREKCKARPSSTCDNCSSQSDFILEDVTSIAKQIVSAVRDICGDTRNSAWANNFTISHIVDIFKGSTVKKVLSAGHDRHPLYGIGKSWQRGDVERLLHKLTLECFLAEIHVASKDGIVNTYTKIGPRASQLLNGTAKIELAMRQKASKGAVAAGSGAKKDTEDAELKAIQDDCYNDLMKKVRDMALERHVNSNSIMNTEALRSMSRLLPETEEEMLNVVGVTKANFDKYGKELLDIIQGYAAAKYVVLAERGAAEVVETGGMESEGIELLDPEWASAHQESPYFGSTGKPSYRGKRKANFRGRGRATKRSRISKSRKRSGSGSLSPKKARGAKRGKASTSSQKNIPKVLPTDRKLPANKRAGFIPLPKVSYL